MRHALVRLTGLLIVLMLVLTGCNLIGIDPMMQLDEDMAAAKKKYSAVVAEYDGGQILQEDVMGSLNSEYSYMSQLYAMYGINMSASMLTDIEQDVVENAVQNVAVAKELESRGLALSDEKAEEVRTTAEENYKTAHDSILESVTGETEAEREKRAEYELYLAGYTQDALDNVQLASAQYELIEETVEGEITEVTDEQLQAAYETAVSDDETSYADAYGSFESAMTSDSTTVYWMPEGYRTVKHILVIPDSEVLQAVTTARSDLTAAEDSIEDLRAELDAVNNPEDAEAAEDEEEAEEAEETEAPRTAEEIQADIDAAEAGLDGLKEAVEKAEADCLASVQDKLDEIYGKIEAGEDFDSLIEAYGEDPGMQNEPTKTRGYYVCANSTNWDANFTAGAMALANIGDVSETPVISASGIHILRYESDVTAGAVALDDVRDALYEDTLETMKHDHFNEELESWIAALNPVYHIDAFNLD